MQKNQPAYMVQDIPSFIQEVLMKYGEKEHIGESEYLRVFSNDVLKKLKEKFFTVELRPLNFYLNFARKTKLFQSNS